MYLRYIQTKNYHLLCDSESQLVRRINFPSLIIGVIAAMGLHVLANFQETSIPPIHFGGAFVCLLLGNVYFIFVVILTFEMPEFSSKGPYNLTQVEWLPKHNNTKFEWLAKYKGREIHLLSAFSEWIAALMYSLLLLSFAPEFHRIQFLSPVFIVKGNEDNI
ncbi:hypothetical protein C0J52_10488 [Blattella germanica]|nr:hypothetical protein C0J52_10488 [Blattella germanica]